MMKRILLGAALALGLGVPAKAETVNILMEGVPDTEYVKSLVPEFEKATGHKVNLEIINYGASFGYNNLVVDLRSFPIMRSFGVPVVFDVTHSLQLPGGLGKATGGQAEYIEDFARAGVACGVDAVFMEVHDDPTSAPSDGPNQLPLSRLERLLTKLKAIHMLVNQEAYLANK